VVLVAYLPPLSVLSRKGRQKMSDKNDDLEQIYFYKTLINKSIDLYKALQSLRGKHKSLPLNVPGHMRGNVDLKPDGFYYYKRRNGQPYNWKKEYEEAIDCMLALKIRLFKSNPNLELPELPKKTEETDAVIGFNKIQECQEWCITAQKIWDSKEPIGDSGVGENTTERPVKEWKKPRGYTGSNTIIYSTVGELKQKLHLPTQGDEKNKIPRSTLGSWRQQDSVKGGELEGETKTDPITYEVYYPNKWLKKQILKYKPKDRNS